MLSESFYLKLAITCKNSYLSLVVVRLVIFVVNVIVVTLLVVADPFICSCDQLMFLEAAVVVVSLVIDVVIVGAVINVVVVDFVLYLYLLLLM